MIYGIGTDIVEVKRIREALNKYGACPIHRRSFLKNVNI